VTVISVIIPVHNRPQSLRRAVLSVLAQRDIRPEDLEVIVVDDASSMPPNVEAFGPRVIAVRLAQNGGPATARNAGIVRSSGTYIAFLDSDDVWLPDKLARQRARFEALVTPATRAARALVSSVYMPDRFTGAIEARIPRPASDLDDFATGCWFLPGSTLFLARDAFAPEATGLFDARLRRLEDLDWFLRFGLRSGRLHVDDAVTTLVAPSASAGASALRHPTSLLAAKFGPTGLMPLPRALWRRFAAYLALEEAAAALSDRDRLAFARHMARSVWLVPRLHPQLAAQWHRIPGCPEDVAAEFAQMRLDVIADRSGLPACLRV